MKSAGYTLLGVATGILSGVLGIGGGAIIMPALIFLFGMNQHQNQGTTLAMLVPPIGILAAYTHYRQGNVQILPAVFLAAGFLWGIGGCKARYPPLQCSAFPYFRYSLASYCAEDDFFPTLAGA